MRVLQKLFCLFQRINTAIFLHAAYLFGVGVVSVVGRAFGMRFLQENSVKTNWKEPTGSADSKRMY